MEKTFITGFGILEGVSVCDYYDGIALRDCSLSKFNIVKTPYGDLIPQYQDYGVRRKSLRSLSFFKNGNIKYISLQEQIILQTSIGPIPAEYLSFYEDMSLRRVFPLDGKMSGYWSEEDEYELAESMEFKLSIGHFRCKVIGVHFYKNGNLKSITLWPKSKVEISTPFGLISARIGVALYEDGSLKSLEPRIPTNINTPIGIITAYDVAALGINGDINSLCFSSKGELAALTTSSDFVRVWDSKGFVTEYAPELRPSVTGDGEFEVVPLRIEFTENKVVFNYIHEYEIEKYSFSIGKAFGKVKQYCSSCSMCTGCS